MFLCLFIKTCIQDNLGDWYNGYAFLSVWWKGSDPIKRASCDPGIGVVTSIIGDRKGLRNYTSQEDITQEINPFSTGTGWILYKVYGGFRILYGTG